MDTLAHFEKPTMIDEKKSWTAEFDSYNQRTEDVYFSVTIWEDDEAVNKFIVKSYRMGSDIDARNYIKADIHQAAIKEKNNRE